MNTDSNEVISSDTPYASDLSLPDVNNLKPYNMESRRSTIDMSASWTDLSSENSSDEEDKKKERIRTTDWCTCGKCKKMLIYTESLCCRDTNEVPDDNYEGSYNNC